MTLKKVYHVGEIQAYSGLKDYFGGRIFVVVNTDLNQLRLYGENPEYKKRRKMLDSRKLQHVITPKYLDVIDISCETAAIIAGEFSGCSHPVWQVY